MSMRPLSHLVTAHRAAQHPRGKWILMKRVRTLHRSSAVPDDGDGRVPRSCLIIAIHDDVFVCGPPARATLALHRLLGLATERCGLTPSGHKFTAYCATAVSAPDAAALHAELDSWTPAAYLGTDRVCRLQSDGVIAGGVPVGSMGFTLAALTTKLEQQGLAHSELRRSHGRPLHVLLSDTPLLPCSALGVLDAHCTAVHDRRTSTDPRPPHARFPCGTAGYARCHPTPTCAIRIHRIWNTG